VATMTQAQSRVGTHWQIPFGIDSLRNEIIGQPRRLRKRSAVVRGQDQCKNELNWIVEWCQEDKCLRSRRRWQTTASRCPAFDHHGLKLTMTSGPGYAPPSLPPFPIFRPARTRSKSPAIQPTRPTLPLCTHCPHRFLSFAHGCKIWQCRPLIIPYLLPYFDKVSRSCVTLLCPLSARTSFQQVFSAVGHSTPHTISNASLLNPLFSVLHVP